MDDEILALVAAAIADNIGKPIEPSAVIGIGSIAYPEFMHERSDLDLIVIHESREDVFGDYLIYGQGRVQSTLRLYEIRVLHRQAFFDHAMTADIAMLYAFVRGYRLIGPTGDAETMAVINLAIGRYFTEAHTLLCDLQATGRHKFLADTRHLMTDARNSVSIRRSVANDALYLFRKMEILKDFIARMWMFHLLRDVDRMDGVPFDPESRLMQEAGMLRVFLGKRGGRMLDSRKYAKQSALGELIDALSGLASLDGDAMFDRFEHLFEKYCGRALFLGEASHEDIDLCH